jgi:hypothetical protein
MYTIRVLYYYGRVLRVIIIKKEPDIRALRRRNDFQRTYTSYIYYNAENAVYDFSLKGDISHENRIGNSIVAGQKNNACVYNRIVVHEKYTRKNKNTTND